MTDDLRPNRIPSHHDTTERQRDRRRTNRGVLPLQPPPAPEWPPVRAVAVPELPPLVGRSTNRATQWPPAAASGPLARTVPDVDAASSADVLSVAVR
ncbi:MAG: hypothetical protein D6725_18370 [Planctomycetota bacterium]|nr:MAG: hypothetical protein D6725_18370 [Planctomycetota bacterium]